LEEVVEDCGAENKQAAELVLYLLTDEKGTRPLKTRAELERDLEGLAVDLTREAGKLDLVLRIFVDSGLVFLLPETPYDRYQLVHDYLAEFIRQQQESRLNELIAALEGERERRKNTEDRLTRIIQSNQILTTVQQQVEQEVEQGNIEKKVPVGWIFIKALGITSLVIGLHYTGFLQPFEWTFYDQFFRLRPR